MRHLKKILFVILVILIVAAIGFGIWASSAAQPMPEALQALQSDSQVQVEQGKWLVFHPSGVQAQTGLVFYPGGRVDPRAYAPAARAIAAQGYLVVITPMPLNLAVLASGQAAHVMAAYPQIAHWAVGGHSLGGSMAAHFFKKNPAAAQGLVLWAAYPSGSDDLSRLPVKVVSIYGTQDGLATTGKIEASVHLLQSSTVYLAIQGGNHGQFGWYGLQSGDGEATISRQEQQDRVVQATVAFLNSLE